MTQEFHISVTPVGANDYLVRTEQVAPGVPLAEELVNWPVDDWLAAAGRLMNDPLSVILQGDAQAARNSVNLVALGQQLYNALFSGTLRDSWITAQGIAQNHQQVLRLRLGLKDTRLARLPWEVMHANDRPIATGPYISFSRYQSGIGTASAKTWRNIPSLAEDGAIKVLMVIASPTDLHRLDLLKQEAIKLKEELQRQSPRLDESGTYLPEIKLTVLEQPGREELTQALEQGRYHVLHYSGHSNVGASGGEIYLVSSKTGLTETLTGDDLAGLLVNNNIQMAVFNSCLGAYAATVTDGDTAERNLTETLVKRGIISVLAMSERIPDDVAVTLTQLFYRNLAQGYPVDLGVGRVRQGLLTAYGAHQMYWALPILYLDQKFNGKLSSLVSDRQTPDLLNQSATPVKTENIYSSITAHGDMPWAIEDMIPPTIVRDSAGLDWLGEETWDDFPGVGDIYEDDPNYASDSAIVAALFNQLEPQKTSSESPYTTTAELVGGKDNSIGSRNLPGNIASQETSKSDNQASNWEIWGDSNPQSSSATGANSQQDIITPSTTIERNKRKPWSVVGMMGVGTILVVIGIAMWGSRPQTPNIPEIPEVSQVNPSNQPQLKLETQELKTTPTGMVTAFATDKLNQGDLKAGLQAVEELLNRNAIPNARAALEVIASGQESNAAVNFYKGRLIWQAWQTGDKKYSVDDARRYWEEAEKAAPNSWEYKNALGFAYYAEGNLVRANDAWLRALDLAIKNKAPKKDTLTAYAGLALGLFKSANQQPPAKRDRYLSEAVKLRQKIIADDPLNFQANQLSKEWLWTEKAITDWKALLKQK